MYEIIEDPDEDDLADIDLETLNKLINISIQPLDDAIEDYSTWERKEVLTWLANDPKASELFRNEDDDFEILKALFDIRTFTSTKESIKQDVVDKLDKNIDSSENNFFEIITEEINDEAIDWLHNFFEEEGVQGG